MWNEFDVLGNGDPSFSHRYILTLNLVTLTLTLVTLTLTLTLALTITLTLITYKKTVFSSRSFVFMWSLGFVLSCDCLVLSWDDGPVLRLSNVDGCLAMTVLSCLVLDCPVL